MLEVNKENVTTSDEVILLPNVAVSNEAIHLPYVAGGDEVVAKPHVTDATIVEQNIVTLDAIISAKCCYIRCGNCSA
jgi:hypothetical protein